jgi:hypothetical protein
MSTRMCEHLLYLQRRMRRMLGRLAREHASLNATCSLLGALEGAGGGRRMPPQAAVRRHLWGQKTALDAACQVSNATHRTSLFHQLGGWSYP